MFASLLAGTSLVAVFLGGIFSLGTHGMNVQASIHTTAPIQQQNISPGNRTANQGPLLMNVCDQSQVFGCEGVKNISQISPPSQRQDIDKHAQHTLNSAVSSGWFPERLFSFESTAPGPLKNIQTAVSVSRDFYQEYIKTTFSPLPDIIVGGDIMLSRSVGMNLKKYGNSYITGSDHPFENVASGSLILLNFESPFSLPDKDTNQATFIFGANPQAGGVLEWLGKNQTLVLSLANNHVFNAGYQGFARTIDTLDALNIAHAGLSKDIRVPYINLRFGTKNYCIGSYSYDGQHYYDKNTQTTWYVNALEESLEDIQAMNVDACDEKIFLLHWGREYRFEPVVSQTKLAHDLIDAGATMIVGNHSHTLGKMEQYKGRVIFYSLGNFIFDQNWGKDSCQKGMDCIFDQELQKNTVPTYIGTAVQVPAPYTTWNEIWQWNINRGKMTKRTVPMAKQ